MNRKVCTIAAASVLVLFVLLPGLLLGAGPLFSLLHLEGDTYDRYASGGWYSGTDPAMSLDGQTIVYSSPRTGRGDLYAVNRDGAGTRQLTRDPLYEAEPCFSPDSRRIVFVKQMKYVGNSYQSHLWIMNADGTGQERVTKDDTEYIRPTFMRDGLHILCLRDAGGNNYTPVIVSLQDGSHKVVAAKPGEVVLVTKRGAVTKHYPGEGYSHAISPDEKQVIFVSEPYSQTLWVMNADGTGRRQIYAHAQHFLAHPTFTPDGKHILFHEVLDGGVGDIMLVRVDGSGRTRMASTR